MIIRKHGYVLDVDIEGTSKYSLEHQLFLCTSFINPRLTPIPGFAILNVGTHRFLITDIHTSGGNIHDP